MDYTKLTLGQLLSSDDVTIRRNAISILKIAQNCDHADGDDSPLCRYCFTPYRHKHDWDNYGKCCECGIWKHQDTLLED